MNRGTVYLIAQPTVPSNGRMPDLSSLAEYGDIKVLIEAGEYPSFKPQDALTKIKYRLASFDAENDYVTWAGGDTLSAVLVGTVLASLGHRRFRWLRFERGRDSNGKRDNLKGRYTPVEVMTLL